MILSKAIRKTSRRLKQMPPEAPKNTLDLVKTLAEAIRFGYSQTLGTWGLFDLPKAIVHAVTDKDKETVASECSERSDCVLLIGPEITKQLYEVKKLLTLTMLFSKKRSEALLFAAGFAKEDVLRRKRTARILKPAFTVVRDNESKCLFVFIRGTRSIKDTLTDAIAAPIPFNHKFISSDGNNRVSGYAHRGMVSAARWIRERCITVLVDALRENSDFKIMIIGHSLGGGTAALLTYMLREMVQFSSCTCVTFGPAACMTLELAEFAKPFITSIVNGSDIVPTLSASSVHDFIYKRRIKDKNIISAVGSSFSFGKVIAEHAVTHCTQVVKKHKQRTHSLLPWSQRENIDTLSSSKSDDFVKASQSSETSCETLLIEENLIMESMSDDDKYNSSSEGSDYDDSDDEEELSDIHAWETEAAPTKNINEESACPVPTSDHLERYPLYPPGKIMHIVNVSSSDKNNSNRKYPDEERVYLYETPPQFYGKLRFSKGIILDHLTKKYMKKLQQLIKQIDNEQFKYDALRSLTINSTS